MQQVLTTPVAEAAETPVKVVSVDDLITQDAAKYGVSAVRLHKVIQCESHFNPEARGDHGMARGLAQIRKDYHPDITEAQADDPAFAIDYMAHQWALGHQRMWSCYALTQ